MRKSIKFLSLIFILILSACTTLAPAPVQAPPTMVAVPTEAPIIVSQPTATAATVVEPTVAAPVVSEPAPTEEPTGVRFAQNFSIEYKDGYKLLTVMMPDSPSPFQYALVPKGESPTVAEAEAMVVETPIEKIVSLSSTYLPTLTQLDELGSLVAVDDATYIFNDKVREAAEAGEIAVVGGDGFSAQLNIEKVLELSPDILMIPYISAPMLDQAKLAEAKLKVVVNADYYENSPLGRAEWSKFLAAFYDKEAEATKAFDEMVARYEAAKALAAKPDTAASVFVNSAFQGTWYMPGRESYVAELLKDAGANYLFAEEVEGSAASPLAFEVVYEKAKDADFWLNVGFASDLAGLVAEDARYAEFKAVAEGKVYNNNARTNPNGGTDFYESGVASPDLVLKDLIKIFYPDLLPEHELFYYTQLH